MNLLHALILGLLQGITEFFPVSSSTHLKMAKMFLGIKEGEAQVLFDLVCHLGTLVALVYFFRKDILRLFTTERKKLLILCLATLPLGPFYFLLKPFREMTTGHFASICLMVTAGFLFLGERFRIRSQGQTKDALIIGTLQSMALLPGISRSASTISCARILGWEAKEAVRFSFLLSIPTVIGGNCVHLLKLLLSSQPSLPALSHCIVGFCTCTAVGLFVIRKAVAVLEKGRLKPFAWYCLIAGILLMVYVSL